MLPSPQPHLIIFAVDQGQLKAVLRGVDGEDTGPALPVQAVNAVSPHTGHIDWQVQGPDDAMITTENTTGPRYIKYPITS